MVNQSLNHLETLLSDRKLILFDTSFFFAEDYKSSLSLLEKELRDLKGSDITYFRNILEDKFNFLRRDSIERRAGSILEVKDELVYVASRFEKKSSRLRGSKDSSNSNVLKKYVALLNSTISRFPKKHGFVSSEDKNARFYDLLCELKKIPISPSERVKQEKTRKKVEDSQTKKIIKTKHVDWNTDERLLSTALNHFIFYKTPTGILTNDKDYGRALTKFYSLCFHKDVSVPFLDLLKSDGIAIYMKKGNYYDAHSFSSIKNFDFDSNVIKKLMPLVEKINSAYNT